jgi:hypothetical protein
MATAKKKPAQTASDLLTRVAEKLAAIIGDEVSKKVHLDEAKADLDNATARGIRSLAEQFELLRGINTPIGESEEKAFLQVFEEGIRSRGANDSTAKARKSDVKTMLVQRHNLSKTLDLVDELKTEVAASDLERKPSINVRAATLKILRTLKQREADAAKGKAGVRLTSPEEEVAALRDSIFSEQEVNPRDELLGLLTRVEEHMLVQVSAVGDTFVPHPSVAAAVATIRKLVLAQDDDLREVEAGAVAGGSVSDSDAQAAISALEDDLEGAEVAEPTAQELAGELEGLDASVLEEDPDEPDALLGGDSEEDLDEFTRGILG